MTPICATCGCSLVRLGIGRADAARLGYRGEELLFCRQGCAELFGADPDRYLQEIADWIVCPTCLAEKPKHLSVWITNEGRRIHFCRCPHCVEEFRRRPVELLERLAG